MAQGRTTQKTAEQEEARTLTLRQKLSKIREIADVVKKDKEGYGYKYTDILEILVKVRAGMNNYGVSLEPKLAGSPEDFCVKEVTTVNTKIDRAGNTFDKTATEYLVKTPIIFTWVDDETGERIEIPWEVVGSQADPSQAFGSGLTYCTRYFLTNYFQIAQTELDVDAVRSKQQEEEHREDLAIAAGLVEQFDGLVRSYIQKNPDKKNDVGKLVKKHVKKGTYMNVKDPKVIADLLKEFNETFGSAETQEKATPEAKTDAKDKEGQES